MLVSTENANAMGMTIDRETHTIRLVRTFEVAPSIIFDAWTQPEQVSCWWDANGQRLTTCEIDLRPGGAFKFVSPGHDDKPFSGTYREIRRPDLLRFDANGAAGTVRLEPSGIGTRMTVEIACSSGEHLEQFLKFGVDVGTSRTLDNLVRHVESRGAGIDARIPHV